MFTGAPTAKINNMTRANTLIRGNEGIVTRSRGSGTVAQNSFVTITRGMDFAPNVGDIRVIPVVDLQSDGRLYVGPTPDATNLSVIMPGGPATLAFAWSVDDS